MQRRCQAFFFAWRNRRVQDRNRTKVGNTDRGQEMGVSDWMQFRKCAITSISHVIHVTWCSLISREHGVDLMTRGSSDPSGRGRRQPPNPSTPERGLPTTRCSPDTPFRRHSHPPRRQLSRLPPPLLRSPCRTRHLLPLCASAVLFVVWRFHSPLPVAPATVRPRRRSSHRHGGLCARAAPPGVGCARRCRPPCARTGAGGDAAHEHCRGGRLLPQ